MVLVLEGAVFGGLLPERMTFKAGGLDNKQSVFQEIFSRLVLHKSNLADYSTNVKHEESFANYL